MEKEKYNRIKAVMAEKDVGVEELANAIGKHPQSIIAYRNNVKQPPLKTLYEIARVLGVDPCELLVKTD